MKPSLQDLIKAAYGGDEQAISSFFESLVDADIYLPVKRDRHKEEAMGFMMVKSEGHQTITIFSKPEYIEVWAKKELPFECKKLSSLLWLIPENTWLHLDPCQDFGRECSPWEIEKLKVGKEAIPDIVAAELEEQQYADYEVNPMPNEFEAEKKKLIPMFEAYSSVEEVTLISIKAGDSPVKPMIGLSLGEIEEKKREILFFEIEQAFAGDSKPIVVTDARTLGSPNFGLFEGANPFYIKQAKSASGSSNRKWLKK